MLSRTTSSGGRRPPCHEGTPVNLWTGLPSEEPRPPAHSQHQLASYVSNWSWILNRKSPRCLQVWPTPWLRPHERPQVCIILLSCSQIPDPQKLDVIIDAYCCFQLGFTAICYTAIGNTHGSLIYSALHSSSLHPNLFLRTTLTFPRGQEPIFSIL